jgi:hypothetical protein
MKCFLLQKFELATRAAKPLCNEFCSHFQLFAQLSYLMPFAHSILAKICSQFLSKDVPLAVC